MLPTSQGVRSAAVVLHKRGRCEKVPGSGGLRLDQGQHLPLGPVALPSTVNGATTTVTLDSRVVLLDLLRELRESGHSVVVVHHDLGTVRHAFDWALVLNVRAVACGPVDTALAPDVLARAYGTDSEAVEWAR